MASHDDNDSPIPFKLRELIGEDELMDRIRQRGFEMTRTRKNTITAGEAHGEQVIYQRTVRDVMGRDMLVKQLPDDPDAVLRISIGMGPLGDGAYLVHRGAMQDCLDLLERAVKSLRSVVDAAARDGEGGGE